MVFLKVFKKNYCENRFHHSGINNYLLRFICYFAFDDSWTILTENSVFSLKTLGNT